MRVLLVRPRTDRHINGVHGARGTVKLLNVSYDPDPAPLEAEVSRERYEGERFNVGQKVGLRFRRWQVYPANGAAA